MSTAVHALSTAAQKQNLFRQLGSRTVLKEAPHRPQSRLKTGARGTCINEARKTLDGCSTQRIPRRSDALDSLRPAQVPGKNSPFFHFAASADQTICESVCGEHTAPIGPQEEMKTIQQEQLKLFIFRRCFHQKRFVPFPNGSRVPEQSWWTSRCERAQTRTSVVRGRGFALV